MFSITVIDKSFVTLYYADIQCYSLFCKILMYAQKSVLLKFPVFGYFYAD
jgi:hypothetical protein